VKPPRLSALIMSSPTYEAAPLLHADDASAAEAKRSKFRRAAVGIAACSTLAVAAFAGLRGGAPISTSGYALGASPSLASSSALTSKASSTHASVASSAKVPHDSRRSKNEKKYPVAKIGQGVEEDLEEEVQMGPVATSYREALGPALTPTKGQWALSEAALDQVASVFASRVGERDSPWLPTADSTPPPPASPPYPGLIPKTEHIHNELDSKLDFTYVPDFPGQVPASSTPGKKVVMIPVANIGASGLSDEQVNLVLKNKAKNAGVGVEALKRRGFFYGVVGEFEVTNAACDFYGQRLTVTLNNAIQAAYTIAHGEGLITPNPHGVNFQQCDTVDDGSYPDFNSRARMMYVASVDRSLADSKEIFTEFIDDVSPVPFARDFNTLVNKAILDTGVTPKAGVQVVQSKEMTQPRLIGWIAIETVEGIAEGLRITNGAVLAAEGAQ